MSRISDNIANQMHVRADFRSMTLTADILGSQLSLEVRCPRLQARLRSMTPAGALRDRSSAGGFDTRHLHDISLCDRRKLAEFVHELREMSQCDSSRVAIMELRTRAVSNAPERQPELALTRELAEELVAEFVRRLDQVAKA